MSIDPEQPDSFFEHLRELIEKEKPNWLPCGCIPGFLTVGIADKKKQIEFVYPCKKHVHGYPGKIVVGMPVTTQGPEITSEIYDTLMSLDKRRAAP